MARWLSVLGGDDEKGDITADWRWHKCTHIYFACTMCKYTIYYAESEPG